jgi:threonine dehydratase
MPVVPVTLLDIYAARKRIAGIARRTPLIHSPPLSERCGAAVYLKLECLQETGSFKIRGAANRMLGLTVEERERGVITVSTGNHGRAVSHVARRLGIRAVVCVSELVPDNKVQAILGFGAEVEVFGRSYDEALERALVLQEEQGLTMIEPFDDALVIAGQGTIGLELLEELPEIDAVIVPLSGGGLFAGVALALKSASASIQTTGVSMERGPAMVNSLRAGQIVDIVEEPTLADALAGGLSSNNAYTFDMVRKLADDTVLVSEEEIAGGMAFMLYEHRLVVEGGGAVGVAGLLSGKVEPQGQHVAVVISGGNVGMQTLLSIARERDRQ